MAVTSDTEVIASLRHVYPHGHPRFLPTTVKEVALHSAKNHDYAAGGSPLGNFERVSAILRLYPNLKLGDQKVVALVYALKQVDAVLWMLNNGHQAQVEGIGERLQDVSVYAKIVMCMAADEAEARYYDQGVGGAMPPKEVSDATEGRVGTADTRAGGRGRMRGEVAPTAAGGGFESGPRYDGARP